MTDREEQARSMLQDIAKEIDSKLPDGFGFTLLAYEFGDTDGRKMLYVSNSDREDIKKAMKEFIEQPNKNFGKDVD